MFPRQGTSERSIALVLRRREGEGFQQELMEHQLGQEGKFKWYSKTIFQATIKAHFFHTNHSCLLSTQALSQCLCSQECGMWHYKKQLDIAVGY